MPSTKGDEARARQRLERLTYWLDDRFRIPGTRWRIGFDFLIGLIPVGGDVFGALLSLWLVNEARRIGAPRALIVRMLGNVGVELLVGLVPVLGDVFDAYWKANRRNLRLLGDHLDARVGAAPGRPNTRPIWLLGALLALGIVILLWWIARGSPGA